MAQSQSATEGGMDRRVKFAAVSAIAAVCIGVAGWQVYGMMNPGQRKLSAEEAAVQGLHDRVIAS